MFTINYKGFYIHGYCDKPECTVNLARYKSLHAAKCAVTRTLIPVHDAAMMRVFTG